VFKIARAAAAVFTLTALGAAHAGVVVTPTTEISTLTNALMAPAAGITITDSTLAKGSTNQQGTFSSLNLAPTSGSTPTMTLGGGVALTSGTVLVPSTNTVNNYSVSPGTGSYAALSTLSGSSTNDSNVLEYQFTLDAAFNAVQMQFLFATDEFPTQSVTDIFGFFVDGTNYAKFPNGELIANKPGSVNFILNAVGSGLYDIEWNGLSNILTVTGLVDTTLSTHSLIIGIADTSDTIFDSAVYMSSLKGVFSTGSGGIGDPNETPEPGTMALVGIAALAMGAMRRRKQ